MSTSPHLPTPHPTDVGDASAAERSAAELPLVTSLHEDLIGHDLAPDTLEFARGTFVPAGDRVMIDVDAAYSFLGNSRGALLLYVGQPDEPGTTLYDCGGKPVAGVRWWSMGSIYGESAWASTTHRRIVVDVDPDRPLTWQLLGAIIGGSDTVPIPDATRIAITPDGTRAFVTSPTQGTVTPIALGRPGYTHDSTRTVDDVGLAPIETGATPGRLATDDAHVVVCHAGENGHVTILDTTGPEILHQVEIPGGSPTDVALSPDGTTAFVTTASGRVVRITVATGERDDAEIGGELRGVAVTADGQAVLVADTAANVVHRLSVADLQVEATTPVPERPHTVRTAPDGRIWVLCDPGADVGRLVGIDPDTCEVVADHALPYPRPSDVAIVPTAGQSSELVRTAWVVYDGGRFSQFLVGGPFEGQTHSFHTGSLGEPDHRPAAVALNDFGEIWVTQPDLDRVWKWPGGRLICRAGTSMPYADVFFGEYCDVSVYGARAAAGGPDVDETPPGPLPL